jgi:hypothetical protein
VNPSVDQFYSGGWPVGMVGHLAVGPITQPYTLTGLVEASWAGYVVSGVSPVQRESDPEDYWFLTVSLTFGNLTPDPQPVTAVWIDGWVGSTRVLVAIQDGSIEPIPPIPPGGVTVQMLLTALAQGTP